MPARDAYPLSAEAYRAFNDVLAGGWGESNLSLDKRLSIGLQFWSGFRVGETLRFGPDDVERTSSGLVVRVPTEVASGTGWTAKTSAGSRSVPVMTDYTDHSTGETVDLPLEDWLRAMEFRGDGIEIESPDTIRFAVAKIAREVGPEPFRRPNTTRRFGRNFIESPDVINHDGRASWCAQALRSDVNRFTIRDWGGWKGTEMINRYASYVGDPSGAQADAF